MSIHVRDDRHVRSLTGVSRTQFEILLEAFTMTYTELKWQTYQDGLAAGSRQRRPGWWWQKRCFAYHERQAVVSALLFQGLSYL